MNKKPLAAKLTNVFSAGLFSLFLLAFFILPAYSCTRRRLPLANFGNKGPSRLAGPRFGKKRRLLANYLFSKDWSVLDTRKKK